MLSLVYVKKMFCTLLLYQRRFFNIANVNSVQKYIRYQQHVF